MTYVHEVCLHGRFFPGQKYDRAQLLQMWPDLEQRSGGRRAKAISWPPCVFGQGMIREDDICVRVCVWASDVIVSLCACQVCERDEFNLTDMLFWFEISRPHDDVTDQVCVL